MQKRLGYQGDKVRRLSAKRAASAQLIDHLKKPDMAREAERLLAGTRWVPEPLRTPDTQSLEVEGGLGPETLPAFLSEREDDEPGDPTASDPEEPHAVAAE